MVTTFGRPGYLRRALDAGASGFVVKDIPGAQLVDAVRRVHAGHRVVDPALAEETLLGGRSPLTDRESDVLRLAVEGAPVAHIASLLHLSPGTVRNHLSGAIRKTGTSTRVEAARTAQDPERRRLEVTVPPLGVAAGRRRTVSAAPHTGPTFRSLFHTSSSAVSSCR
jgi:two-component system, NarL family, response regulator DesR